MKSLEHERAQFAHDKIKSIKDKDAKDKKEYRSCIMNLGTLILSNGLLATVAFYNTKKDHHKNVIKWIIERLHKEKLLSDNLNNDIIDNFIEYILQLNTEGYILYTTAVLNFANWLKRFADAMLKEKDKKEG